VRWSPPIPERLGVFYKAHRVACLSLANAAAILTLTCLLAALFHLGSDSNAMAESPDAARHRAVEEARRRTRTSARREPVAAPAVEAPSPDASAIGRREYEVQVREGGGPPEPEPLAPHADPSPADLEAEGVPEPVVEIEDPPPDGDASGFVEEPAPPGETP